jgi:dihydroflavonol-4-reductase
MSQKVLVTGGTGFLGAYIVKALVLAGYTVRAIKRENSALPFFIPSAILDKIEWVTGDVLDIVQLQQAMQGMDSVVHSAAVVSFLSSERAAMYATNIQGTANVVNTALEAGIKKLIHISSVAAIGRTMQQELTNEEKTFTENKANTHYGISKHQAEMEVWRGFAEGLDGVILNPSTILGYGNWNNSSCAIFKNVYNEFAWYTNGTNGFVGVDDLAGIVVQFLQSDISGERYIVSADNWRFSQLLNQIADGFKKKRPWRLATPWLSQVAWRIEKIKSMVSGEKPLLTRETAKIAQTATSFDNRKMLAALPGFQFTPLEEVIKQSTALYLARHSQ